MSKATWQRWQEVMGEALKASPVYYLRLYDTRSAKAQTYLPKQPADHLILHKGRGVLVEDKTTEVMETAEACYTSGVFDPAQINKHRLWIMRGGAAFHTLYIHKLNRAELWTSEALVERHIAKQKLFHVEHPEQLIRADNQPLFISHDKKTLAKHAESIVESILLALS